MNDKERMAEGMRQWEHLRHMTDGWWHDDCRWCLNRRVHGGNGIPPEERIPGVWDGHRYVLAEP